MDSASRLPDDNYRALLRCLNCKQKQFYNHVVHWIKTKDTPLYVFFLSGGAGVGKSVVIRALYQICIAYLTSDGKHDGVLLCEGIYTENFIQH